MPVTNHEQPTDEKITLSRSDLLAMIEDAVSERVARLEIQPPQTMQSDVVALGEAIANSTAEIANQGIGKRPTVDAKILKARRDAHKAMLMAINDAIKNDDHPEYRITNVCFLGGTMVWPKWSTPQGQEQSTIIEWRSIPNLAMEPVNESAKRIFSLFMRSIGNSDTTVDSPYPETSGSKNLKYVQGGPAPIGAVMDLGKAHAGDTGLKIVSGQPLANTDNRLLNVIERVKLGA